MTLQGWECPRCGTVWAPHVPKCECAPTKRVITYDPDNSPIVLRYEWPRPEDLKVTCGTFDTVQVREL